MSDENDEEEIFFIKDAEAWSKKPRSEVEQAILAMENAHVCLHPKHCHSFQQVNFMLSLRKCAGCDQRLQAVVFGPGSDASNQVVRCVACGAVAHRSCALSNSIEWSELCPVNAAQISSGSSEITFDSNIDESSDAVGTSNVMTFDSNTDDSSDTVESSNVMSRAKMGPPPQIFNEQMTKNRVQSISLPEVEPVNLGENDNCDDDEVHVAPLHYANHPFASVSRALQENISAHLRRLHAEIAPEHRESMNVQDTSIEEDMVEIKPAQENPLLKFASGTIDAVKATVSNPSNKMGAVAIAGGIAGGVAGLAIAGPAGSFAGWQLGTTGSALGVILEGGISVGVFVASVATGGLTAQHIEEQLDERRVLTMGEEGTSRKVLLVRPNIQIDPVWDEICMEAKRLAPNRRGAANFAFLPNVHGATHERYRRDSDIVKTDEEEIPTNDKVLLLVSRVLSDKSSLPGYVYRYLIDAFMDRCKKRQKIVEENESIAGFSPRVRRDDAHAVIKHVTATLLEVRPGFGSSIAVTELTAIAVEGLVFAKLYDLVFEEIVLETAKHDSALQKKIEAFEAENSQNALISDQALQALRMLPEAHTAVDKLYYCVQFLEYISEQFCAAMDGGICADSLLKMVCQHVIIANLPDMNAEVAFLEEFARDEQLLRGREGYALVTLQASLHFLNMSEDLSTGIFGQEDDEENIPLKE